LQLACNGGCVGALTQLGHWISAAAAAANWGNGFAQCKLCLAALVHHQIKDDISLCFFVSKQLDYGDDVVVQGC
jgi:hypothetical protein